VWTGGTVLSWSWSPRNCSALLPESTVVTAYIQKQKPKEQVFMRLRAEAGAAKETGIIRWLSLPWKEEVLRSLSMSFLSGRLSSTARTWNGVSVATAAMTDRNKAAAELQGRIGVVEEERLEEVCVLWLGIRGWCFAF
jgi:hypothetical protein